MRKGALPAMEELNPQGAIGGSPIQLNLRDEELKGRVCVPGYQDGIASALVAKVLPVKRWATISPDYEYGHTSWKMFRAYLKRFKPDVEFVAESFAKFGTVD